MRRVDDTERERRIQRRRNVVSLIKAMHGDDSAQVESLITKLAADDDPQKVIGALAVAGSTLADSLTKVSSRTADDILDELSEKLASAPVE
jgi:hypothetical protein